MTRGRKACRSGQRCEPRTWGEALYCLVQHSNLEPAEIAARIGKRVGYLLDASNPDREDTKFQAELLTAVMHVTHNLAPLHYLCAEFGGVFLPLPAAAASDDEVLAAFARAVAEVGESGSAITQGLEDRTLTPEEAQRACREIDETIAAFVQVKALVRSRAGVPL